MTVQFKPERPNGVLYDGRGNVVYRFAGFETDVWHDGPEFVDGFHGIDYSSSSTPGAALGKPIEADPDIPDLPDPTPPDHANARPRHETTNPDAGRFKNTRT